MPDDDDPDAPVTVQLNDLDGQRFAAAMKDPPEPTTALRELFLIERLTGVPVPPPTPLLDQPKAAKPKSPRDRARDAWKDWTPADVEEELAPWPPAPETCPDDADPPRYLDMIEDAIARGESNIDCWSPALPAALALTPAARARQEGYADRRRQFSDEAFTTGPLQPIVPFRKRVNVDAPARDDTPAVDVTVEVVNWCGICGQTFRIAPDDPHWSTGRGPICPAPKAKP